MDKYVIALYIRLSLEDSKYDSMSIGNQQSILREKAMTLPEFDHAEIREFVDNGHTGGGSQGSASLLGADGLFGLDPHGFGVAS